MCQEINLHCWSEPPEDKLNAAAPVETKRRGDEVAAVPPQPADPEARRAHNTPSNI